MSNVNLHTYADEGRLVDADIVGFLRKKLDKGDKLDKSDKDKSVLPNPEPSSARSKIESLE